MQQLIRNNRKTYENNKNTRALFRRLDRRTSSESSAGFSSDTLVGVLQFLSLELLIISKTGDRKWQRRRAGEY